jgi:hypothetical protein
MAPTQFGVGAGIPRPIAWTIDLGGEYPPLQCWAHYFFKSHKPTSNLRRSLRGGDSVNIFMALCIHD